MTQRFLCRVQYVGTGYIGWASQAAEASRPSDGKRSIQTALRDALDRFVGAANHAGIEGSSRTDKDVHAIASTFHIDISKPHTAYEVWSGLNWHLGADRNAIAVIDATSVSDSVHARFSALGREYHYKIVAPREAQSKRMLARALPLHTDRAWCTPQPLDVGAMRAAASHLIGKHDFSSFRGSGCGASSPVRTIEEIAVHLEEADDSAVSLVDESQAISIVVKAPSFLYHQVRNLVGALHEVGSGRWQSNDIATLLAARSRANAPQMAPACGLYLRRVLYDEL